MSSTAVPVLPGAWKLSGAVVAWPHGWQRPARTEEWSFEQYASCGAHPHFAQVVAFPWATLVDLLDRGHLVRARPFLDALALAPPLATLVRATVCQHVRVERVLPMLKSLRVTDLFWSHARNDQPVLDGIRVHPFPLYPVRALDRASPIAFEATPIGERRLLYSFVGAYAREGYLSPVREWIFDLPQRPDAHVVRRDQWHYETMVYGEQIALRETPPDQRARLAREGDAFDAVLLDSIFSLCPSGSGPNSIRLWESLGFGCIPVLLADTLRLPGSAEEWDAAIVRVPETRDAVAALPARLQEIAGDPERLRRMQTAGRRLWVRYGERGPSTVLGVLDDRGWIRERCRSADTAFAAA
ncbi:MAG: exostosin family protein [Lautropia sp.]